MIQELNLQITNGKLCCPEETEILFEDNLCYIDRHIDYAKTVSNIILKNNNISIKCLIIGDDDKEKAMWTLGFLNGIAYNLSYQKYGSIHRWKKFFIMEKDIAIILPEEIMKLKNRARKQHHLYFLDDIGFAYDDSEWMLNADKIMDQIFDPKDNYNNCIAATMRSSKWMGCEAIRHFNFPQCPP
ncbi:MAG: hypothetical protein A4E28_02680 [Methanocella sp. PtaU1.Bin125]|nr:MAG: hypothetical protein A4E28_02680 [Methanocella sp. PtaU1.Bin125]